MQSKDFFLRILPQKKRPECLILKHNSFESVQEIKQEEYAPQRREHHKRIANSSLKNKRDESNDRNKDEFVAKLIEGEKQAESRFAVENFNALRKLAKFYDIKHLEKPKYTNIIKSFGLSIESMQRTQRKEVSDVRDQLLIRSIQPSKTERSINKWNLSLTEKKASKVMKINKVGIENTAKSKEMNQTANTAFQRIKQEPSINTLSIVKHNQIKQYNSIQISKMRRSQYRSSKKPFRFCHSQNLIKEKVNKYRQFLFALNFSNKMYRNMDIENYAQKFKYFVGKGNNSNLIRSLMKNRFWFQESQSQDISNFVWSQIKKPEVLKRKEDVEADEFSFRAQNKKIRANGNYEKQDPHCRILTEEQLKEYSVFRGERDTYMKQSKIFSSRLKHSIRELRSLTISLQNVIHNHFSSNGLLGNKKAMFFSLRKYCQLIGRNVFQIVPLTYIIDKGQFDKEFTTFQQYFKAKSLKKLPNYWIMKPGQFSNRGNGIECTNKLEQIKKKISNCKGKLGLKRSIILQEYITKPLLYNNRKFDIRAYMLVTHHNNKTKAYWYQEGYIRTSSSFFNLEEIQDSYIHLTNDAIQQHSDNYGRFEEGNKLSYLEMQRYLDSLPPRGRMLNIEQNLCPQMKSIAAIAIKSTFLFLNGKTNQNNFELFGLDFMVDEQFKPWLIEVNTNPCLQLSSGVLERLIPHMLENVFRISVDTIFPPPSVFLTTHKYSIAQNALHYNRFQLIFDCERDGKDLTQLYKNQDFFTKLQQLEEDKTEYTLEGELLELKDC